MRNKNKSQIYEFYYQIEAKESSINDLSKKHSSGSEKAKLGIIGPVNLKNINSEIAEILKTSKDSIINDPIEINKMVPNTKKNLYLQYIVNIMRIKYVWSC